MPVTHVNAILFFRMNTLVCQYSCIFPHSRKKWKTSFPTFLYYSGFPQFLSNRKRFSNWGKMLFAFSFNMPFIFFTANYYKQFSKNKTPLIKRQTIKQVFSQKAITIPFSSCLQPHCPCTTGRPIPQNILSSSAGHQIP